MKRGVTHIGEVGSRLLPRWHRFGLDHIDLCDALSGYGGSTKPSRAEMPALANIPGRVGGVDGGQLEAVVAASRLIHMEIGGEFGATALVGN